MRKLFIAAGALLAAMPATAQDAAPAPERIDQVITAAFERAPAELRTRTEPDQTMAICNASRNLPDHAGEDVILELAAASIVYPESGQLMGDWRRGEALAQSGYGMRFTDYPAARENGGNCYACHQLTEAEVSYGTIGPSLRHYGELRDYDEESIRDAYHKIYNPHLALPCTMMPRFGANGVLTPEQIADIVALLMDPESPVNQ